MFTRSKRTVVTLSGAVSHSRLGTTKLGDHQNELGPSQTVNKSSRTDSKHLNRTAGKASENVNKPNNNTISIAESVHTLASSNGAVSHSRLGITTLENCPREPGPTNNPTTNKTTKIKNAAAIEPARKIKTKTKIINSEQTSPDSIVTLASEIKTKLTRFKPGQNLINKDTLELLKCMSLWIEAVSIEIENSKTAEPNGTAKPSNYEKAERVPDKDVNKAREPGKATLLSTVSCTARVENYKAKSIKSDSFACVEELPDFNTGRKPLNPANPHLLDRMIAVECESPEVFVKLDSDLDKMDQINRGLINIDKIDVNKNGKATITCESSEQKGELIGALTNLGYNPREIQKKNFNFALFGISKSKSSADILDEMKRKNPAKFGGVKLLDRFNMNNLQDVLVITCNDESRKQIIKQPYVHLSKRKFKLQNFIELTQCYKCSKFGHKSELCQANKLACPNCAGNHQLRDCPINHKPKCSNCSSLKTVEGVEHSSWDVRCPYRKLWIVKQRTSSYG